MGNEIDDVTFFAGLTAAAPTEDPSTSFARYDSVENFSVLFIGTGLGDYDVDGFPTSGTITEFLIYDITPGTPPIFTLNATWAGMTSDAAMFHDWVAGAPGGRDDFRAAVFGSADTLTGSQYSDFLSGYDGDDVIISGGSDSDEGETLDGGADDDTIVVSGAYAGSSTINGSNNSVFTAIGAAGKLASAAFHIGAAAHDTSDRIIYNSATGALLYDADGNGAGASVQIATLDTALVLTSGDFGVI